MDEPALEIPPRGLWGSFYLVQCAANEQASEAAMQGATVQVAEHGLPQVLTVAPPTTTSTSPALSERRVSRWSASFFRFLFMRLPLHGW